MTMGPSGTEATGTGKAQSALRQFLMIDQAIFDAVCSTSTPSLDPLFRRLTEAANYSRVPIGVSTILVATGGRRGRKTAARCLLVTSITSVLVNAVAKFEFHRPRPHPCRSVPERTVPTPASSSFPSGHAASAFAFATTLAYEYPMLTVPAVVLALAIGYSRIHTGVHYPFDVIAGSLIGMSVASAGNIVSMSRDRKG